MSIIPRNEAIFKLQKVSSRINQAVRAARENDWKQSFSEAYDAKEELTALLKHLEEAADFVDSIPDITVNNRSNLVGSLSYGVPPGVTPGPAQEAPRKGGMGYKVKDKEKEHKKANPSMHSLRPPEPIALPPQPKPIITPPPSSAPAAAAAKTSAAPKRTIVTPPPSAPKPEAPKPRDIVTFDLKRMSGQDEYIRASIQGAPGLTNEEWEITELYDTLDKSLRDQIVQAYRFTGKPVTLRRKADGGWGL